MKKTLTLATLVLVLSVGGDVLLACGDKFFLVGRGDRFSRTYRSLNPGNVLIYAGGTTTISKGLRDVRLQKYIRNAGHHVLVAEDQAALRRALETESVDVIVTGLGQAVSLVSQATASSSRPTLLPIEGEGGDARQASQPEFTARLKSSDKINRFLKGIEDVMKARSAANRGSQG